MAGRYISVNACEAKVCEKGGGGLVLPLLGDTEQDWPNGLRIVLYGAGLMWFFMGVAIVADVFMGAIEKITSKKKRKWEPQMNKYITVTIWNDTVANLTLMALGSSAPEILLSLIELISKDFYSGELGPSTIVGSAAFNLLMITAVCVMAIPNGESRTIKYMGVFNVTATFSVFAYLWLYAIVSIISKDVIDMWEGVLTFLFFPLLVGLAYMADKGYFSANPAEQAESRSQGPLSEMSKEELAALERKVYKRNNITLSEVQLAKVLEVELAAPKTRAAWRVSATRRMVGGRRISSSGDDITVAKNRVVPVEEESGDFHDDVVKVQLRFQSPSYAVMENIGSVSINIVLSPPVQTNTLSVDYKSRDGTAHEKHDYEPVHGRLEFGPGESRKPIVVKIIDDSAFEDDELFYIDLSNPMSREPGCIAELGEHATCTVAILDDDHPGTIVFEEEFIKVQEDHQDKVLAVKVLRKGGCNGPISCKYATEDDSAIQGNDYEKLEGVLHFESGQAAATINLTIIARGRYESSDQFRLILSEPKGGARFEASTDGGETQNILTVCILPSVEIKDRIDKVKSIINLNWGKAQLGHANWKDQFHDAFFVNGGDDEDHEAGWSDKLLHVITVFWKVLFALIPPVDFADGWLCFCCALGMIGIVTAFIGDLAALLGCCVGIPDSITAITFVALGTSLPDTFASKQAAEQDEYADASIGNVTGSNSVNVFLGLGLPWMIGTFYWAGKGLDSRWVNRYPEVASNYKDGGKFVVVGGDLGFSVIVFTICALTCFAILVARRKMHNAELGGPTCLKVITAITLAVLWVLYVGLSSWKVLETLKDDPCK